jgi:oligosaccharide repeat unit polymerase
MERAAAVLSVLAVFGAIMILGRLFVRRRFDVMFLSLLLFGFWFVFRPIQLAIGLDGPTPDYIFTTGHLDLVIMAEGAALAWLASFALGAYAANAVGAPVMALFPTLRAEPNPSLVLIGLVALTLLSTAVTLWLLAASGGTLAESIRFVKAEKAVTGFYFLRQFAVLGVLLATFAFFYFSYLTRARGLYAPRWWSVLALLCFAACAFGIYAWGQRYSIAMATVALAAGFHYFVRRLRWAELIGLGAIFLFAFLGLRLLRDALVFHESVISPLDTGNIWRKIAVSMHGSQFDALLLAFRDYDLEAGLRWGEDFFAGLAALIPRQLWPDRPTYNTGAWFRQIYEPETLNGWPLTPLGDWLVNFGYAGLAIGGALSGYFIRSAQLVYDDLWRNPWSMMMSVVAALFVLPGGLTVASPQSFLSTVLPLAIIALALRIFGQARRPWGVEQYDPVPDSPSRRAPDFA